jgi:antitoxin ParD1/3/4
MAKRASLSISEPNEKWIQAQIDSKEFSSRSEVVNDLIRKAREIEMIRAKLIASELAAEQNGFVDKSSADMLEGFKEKARRDGKL